MAEDRWIFPDPPNVATITTRKILSGEHLIDYVTHDEDDGQWQFLNWQAGAQMKEAMLVSLKRVLSLDSSLHELHDLPLGWQARRDGKNGPWRRARSG